MNEKLRQIKLENLKKGRQNQTREAVERYNRNPAICQNCGKVINLDGRQKPAAIKKKKFCNHSCAAKFNNLNVDRWRGKRVPKLKPLPKKTIADETKAEVRAKAKTFQYYQIYINRHARKTYESSGKPKVCKVCGYSLHVEICHIKDVKDFPGSALISEINHIDNLVTLCRNHHWEFDHGHIKLDPS